MASYTVGPPKQPPPPIPQKPVLDPQGWMKDPNYFDNYIKQMTAYNTAVNAQPPGSPWPAMAGDPNYSGMPQRPQWEDLRNAGGTLPGYATDTTKLDNTGYDAFKNRALSSSPSPWASLATQSNALAAKGQRDATGAQVGSAQAGQLGELARSGGYTGGARERIARDASRTGMMQNQAINQGEQTGNVDIAKTDASNKNAMLSQLPGMDLSRAQFGSQQSQYNIGNIMEEKRAKDMADIAAYHDQISAWGAGKTADATANSGK